MSVRERKYDLEDRLVKYCANLIDIVEALPSTRSGNYIAGQLVRCGLAPALNYGEAQGAESRSDFIHKMKISLKELKETRACLKIILAKMDVGGPAALLEENQQLIGIFAKSILTAKNNQNQDLPP
ncbi:MAG: four helix bundle protein [Chryseolinea sp.]